MRRTAEPIFAFAAFAVKIARRSLKARAFRMDSQFFYDLVGLYGLYAIFLLTMIEGDITLLLAGVLAHTGFFGEYGFAKVLLVGTLGGSTGDALAYIAGRGFCTSVRDFRFYRAARPRIERLTEKFGPLSILLSKYIYGLRTASCVFYGVGRMPPRRFLPLSLISCFLWVFILSGTGYFFSGAVTSLIGDFHQIGLALLVIVASGILGFYLIERYWLAKKVEEVDPQTVHKLELTAHEKLQEIEQVAQERLHELSHEIQEHLARRRESKREVERLAHQKRKEGK